MLGALSAVLGFVISLQLRSQAVVVQSLQGQDNTEVALLIDNLNRSNVALLEQTYTLAQQRDQLRAAARSGGLNPAALRQQRAALQAVTGELAVQGPGVIFTVVGLQAAVDLEDEMNAFYNGGAEAVDLNGHRLVQGAVISDGGGGITIDGQPAESPWSFTVIGDAAALTTQCALIAAPLRANSQVVSVNFTTRDLLVITSTRAAHPWYYTRAR
ncbi:MAG: DUF881 domain-containing protein [Candidatus Dormibacteria bacterium]